MKKLLKRLLARFAWQPVDCSLTREVERNSVSGLFRWRSVQHYPHGKLVGPWRIGAPPAFTLNPIFADVDRERIQRNLAVIEASYHGKRVV